MYQARDNEAVKVMDTSNRYAIPDEVLAASRQVFCYRLDTERVWVKQRRRNKNPLGWWAQKILYGLTGNLLLLPPDRPVGDNVRFEVGVLRHMRDCGVNVPEVLYMTDRYFVLREVGITLGEYLRTHQGDRQAVLTQAAQALRALHDKGLAHGGTQIKNLMFHEGEIYFIDFEENIPAERLQLFQVRDVFLFLLSLERAGYEPDIPALCRTYSPERGDELFQTIGQAVTLFSVARLAKWRLLDRFRMSDIRALCRFVDRVERQNRA